MGSGESITISWIFFRKLVNKQQLKQQDPKKIYPPIKFKQPFRPLPEKIVKRLTDPPPGFLTYVHCDDVESEKVSTKENS
jgi:hypothetical protein